MFAPALSERLRRPDLGRGEAGATYGRNAAGIDSGDVRLRRARGDITLVSGRVSGDLSTGAVSATILAVLVVGVVAFYVWTRGSQA